MDNQTISIQIISETQFKTIENIRQIIVHDHPRQFAAIAFDHLAPFGISWRSDLVKPILAHSPDYSTAWIGIDQQLIALDLPQDRIAVALPLTSTIVQILATPSFTAVLTELDLLIFNPGRSLRCIKELPDLGMDLSLQGTTVMIQLLEGPSLMLDTTTGTFKEPAIAV